MNPPEITPGLIPALDGVPMVEKLIELQLEAGMLRQVAQYTAYPNYKRCVLAQIKQLDALADLARQASRN